MKMTCKFCGGQRKWASGVSVVTGETFYTTCPICSGTGFVDDETPLTDHLTDAEKAELLNKHVKENIQRAQDIKVISDAIRICPGAFKR